MTGAAKRAIRTSFIKLLNQRPLSQITVRDIVEDCGVNRNTFYYHFQDIPHLAEAIINEHADLVIREHPSIDSLEACLRAAIGFALENKKAVLHIYHSVNRDLYEQYQWRVCVHAVTVYIDGILTGRAVSAQDRAVIVDHLCCAFFGIIMGWLESGMPEGILARFQRICELKHGELERMIARCEQG